MSASLPPEAVAREVDTICARHDLRRVRILRVHRRKRTATVHVTRRTGGDRVLKCALSGASRESLEGLRLETEFLASEKFALAPPLEFASTDHHVREHRTGMPVREWILRQPGEAAARLPELMPGLIRALASTRRVSGGREWAGEAAPAVVSRFRNLVTSGPAGTERGRAADRVARLAASGAGLALRSLVLRTLRVWEGRGVRCVSAFSHNDLHGDNVLIGPNDLSVIDFENVTRPGFWWVDVLYFTGTCIAALEGASARVRLRETVARVVEELEPGMGREFSLLLHLFSGAALSNGRFRAGGSPYGAR